MALCLERLVLLEAPLHEVGVRLGVVRPALFLEEILDLGDVVLDEDEALVAGGAGLQRSEGGSVSEWVGATRAGWVLPWQAAASC